MTDHWDAGARASIGAAPQGTGAVSGAATARLGDGPDAVARGVALLGDGRLVGFPTETVYGLGADGRNGRTVAALYAAKGRPRFNPLIAHVADAAAARVEGTFDRDADRLAEALWPGPLTLVVPIATSASVCDLARAGLSSVALRVPSHPLAAALLRGCGFPVVAPSANLSGRLSPTEAAHVLADLDGRIDAVLDGGPTEVGVESTIVACLGEGPVLLRPGGVPRERIVEILGREIANPIPAGDRPLAPGALASHYAPRASVRLDVESIRTGEAALLFGDTGFGARCEGTPTLNLSPSGNLAEAAANLFGHLRRLDASGATTIAVAPIPDRGLGRAINDRLRRASATRS